MRNKLLEIFLTNPNGSSHSMPKTIATAKSFGKIPKKRLKKR